MRGKEVDAANTVSLSRCVARWVDEARMVVADRVSRGLSLGAFVRSANREAHPRLLFPVAAHLGSGINEADPILVDGN